MVITREIRDEIASEVNKALKNYLSNESFLKTIADNVSNAIIKTVELKLSHIETTLTNMQADVTNIRDENKVTAEKVDRHTNDFLHYKTRMERKYDRIDRYSRKCNLRIFGFEGRPNEQTGESIISFLNSKMSMKLTKDDMEVCYRVGRKGGEKSRAVFLKVNNFNLKDQIYRKKRLLKGTGVVIREDLTSHGVELYSKCVEKAGMKNVWTDSGKVYIFKDKKKIF
ncbi:uncharacterized protein LOC123682005 [Harmonia axyridis]|uniref:uncharacterized protein LOC123682005 n=1 Tax=Harmonia axyridis TaxID=115357 RepID=UPI001E274FD7|nr:uncharacterized protein LOC123682005 [Harmonia axyridis]